MSFSAWLTYDTGALIAAERDERIFWSLHRAALGRAVRRDLNADFRQ